MKTAYLTQDTRYGRNWFELDSGTLSVVSGIGSARDEKRFPVGTLNPKLARETRRFVGGAVFVLFATYIVIKVVWWLANRFPVMAKGIEVNVMEFYGLMVAIPVAMAGLWMACGLFIRVELITCLTEDGQPAAMFVRDKRYRDEVDRFTSLLVEVIETKRSIKEAEPGATDNPVGA